MEYTPHGVDVMSLEKWPFERENLL